MSLRELSRWASAAAERRRRARPGEASSLAASRTRDEQWPELGFDELIGTTRFDVSEKPHIVVDGAVCAECSTRDCVVACPAKLFVPTADGGILFNYEQCFECGTCYLVCNREGAISWSYPEGGHGVVFRRS